MKKWSESKHQSGWVLLGQKLAADTVQCKEWHEAGDIAVIPYQRTGTAGPPKAPPPNTSITEYPLLATASSSPPSRGEDVSLFQRAETANSKCFTPRCISVGNED